MPLRNLIDIDMLPEWSKGWTQVPLAQAAGSNPKGVSFAVCGLFSPGLPGKAEEQHDWYLFQTQVWNRYLVRFR